MEKISHWYLSLKFGFGIGNTVLSESIDEIGFQFSVWDLNQNSGFGRTLLLVIQIHLDFGLLDYYKMFRYIPTCFGVTESILGFALTIIIDYSTKIKFIFIKRFPLPTSMTWFFRMRKKRKKFFLRELWWAALGCIALFHASSWVFFLCTIWFCFNFSIECLLFKL